MLLLLVPEPVRSSVSPPRIDGMFLQNFENARLVKKPT